MYAELTEEQIDRVAEAVHMFDAAGRRWSCWSGSGAAWWRGGAHAALRLGRVWGWGGEVFTMPDILGTFSRKPRGQVTAIKIRLGPAALCLYRTLMILRGARAPKPGPRAR